MSGVAARFKKINPFMTSNHCISHRLHLAGKDASEEVIYFEKYEKTLKNLYSYFSKSYKRQHILKMMQVIIIIDHFYILIFFLLILFINNFLLLSRKLMKNHHL
jgi:hypothetical protein